MEEGHEPVGGGLSQDLWLQKEFRPGPLLCMLPIVKGSSSVLYHHQDQGKCVLPQPYINLPSLPISR